MRCPSCEKFVSYDTEVEPEESSAVEVSEDGDLTATYRRVLTCAECGEELKDAELEFNENILGTDVPECSNEDGHEWEVDGDVTAEATTDVQNTDRKGKVITNPRYMKTLYGVEISGTVKCTHCEHTVPFSLKNHEAASGFNELV